MLLYSKHIMFEPDTSSSLDCVKEQVHFKQKSVSEAVMISGDHACISLRSVEKF